MTNSSDPNLDINDVIDLSVVELYILNYLVQIAGSIVRFSVYTEINDKLSDSQISRSSFYNSLNKLQEKGFVEIGDNPTGKGSLVKALPLAQQAIDQVNIFNIWGSINPSQYFQKTIGENADTIYPQSIQRQLIIPFVDPINENTLRLMAEKPAVNYLLTTDKHYQRFSDKFSQTRIEHGFIREPDGFFDMVVFFRFHRRANLMGLNLSELIKETRRVTREGGKLVFIRFDTKMLSSNLLLESVLEDINALESEDQFVDYLKEILRIKDDSITDLSTTNVLFVSVDVNSGE